MKRKDNKGRVLKTGESQRKDLIYQYRYTDSRGKRQRTVINPIANSETDTQTAVARGRPCMHRLCRSFARKKRRFRSR